MFELWGLQICAVIVGKLCTQFSKNLDCYLKNTFPSCPGFKSSWYLTHLPFSFTLSEWITPSEIFVWYQSSNGNTCPHDHDNAILHYSIQYIKFSCHGIYVFLNRSISLSTNLSIPLSLSVYMSLWMQVCLCNSH